MTVAEQHLNDVARAMIDWRAAIAEGVPALAEAVRASRITLLYGNGGSHACAEHWATDWSKVKLDHNDPWRGVIFAPLGSASLLTMLANDYGWDSSADYSHSGDLTIAISTSGRSSNLLEFQADWAVCPAGSPLQGRAEHAIVGPEFAPPVLEDVYSALGHAVARELAR